MPFIKVNNHSLHYTDSQASPESQSTPRATLILVHGLGSTQNYYSPILPSLIESGYRCITFDNYGAGRSEYIEGQDASIEGIGADVITLLDELKIPTAIVGGYSMGGMVPTYLASTRPDRVLAGICIGPVNPNPGVAEVFRKRIETVREGKIYSMTHGVRPSRGRLRSPLQLWRSN
jgi:pimeloyl-ACP methyl ester carboxylesterase